MSKEREEYTRETYPSFGKKYNNEKAIISLTSWKARINTVSKTLCSLIKRCPGFHIVLVLSEEEFPQKEKELPENLMLFVENDLIELLWVYKNYKSFKKVLFTMDKYRDVPVISADDGCVYIRNYAEELYQEWLKNKNSIISETSVDRYDVKILMGGCGILYPPYCFGELSIKCLYDKIINSLQDDGFIGCMINFLRIPVKTLYTIGRNGSYAQHQTFKDFNNARSTSIWNNKNCKDENIKWYKTLFNI